MVSRKNPNIVFSHFTSEVGDNLMSIFALYPKSGVRVTFLNDPIKLYMIFFSHFKTFSPWLLF